MSHKEFVLAYENGNIGCGVSTWTTWWLFIGGKIRQKKLSRRLFLWSVSFPVVMTGSGLGFLNFRFFWAILETAVTLVLWTFAFFYWVAEFVLSTALDSEEFYEFAQANRLLWVYPGD
jgi:hypothetical protein